MKNVIKFRILCSSLVLNQPTEIPFARSKVTGKFFVEHFPTTKDENKHDLTQQRFIFTTQSQFDLRA